jgi:hypothetical protein
LEFQAHSIGKCRVKLPAVLEVYLEQPIVSQTSMVLTCNLQSQLVNTVTYAKGVEATQTVIFL